MIYDCGNLGHKLYSMNSVYFVIVYMEKGKATKKLFALTLIANYAIV